MTIKEAAVISAFTGYIIGSFNDCHKYIEQKARRSVYTHELASYNKKFLNELHEKIRPDFYAIKVEG